MVYLQTTYELRFSRANPGFVVRGGGGEGASAGDGSGDRLRSPAGPEQNPGSGPRGAKPP